MRWKIHRLVVLVGWNVALTILLIETTLRLFPQALPTSSSDVMVVPHPHLTTWFKPSLETKFIGECFEGHVRFNELGFRSRPLSELRSKKEAWLFVGDSMVQGLQVDNEELFTSILQKRYPEVAILNMAKSGSGPIYYNKMVRYFLENEHLHHNITKLYYFIYMGNDFSNLFLEREMTPGKALFKKYSYRFKLFQLATLFYARYLVWTAPALIGSEKKNSMPFYAYPNPVFSEALQKLRAALSALKELTRKRGIQTIVVSVPTTKQMQSEIDSEISKFPVDNIKQITDELQFDFYDLTTDLILHRQETGSDIFQYVFECDGHFNAKGHKTLAALLTDKGPINKSANGY